MKYKGFEIITAYDVGSDFSVSEDGRVIPRKPKKEDRYYELSDPLAGGKWTTCPTLAEAKRKIRELLEVMGVSKNQ